MNRSTFNVLLMSFSFLFIFTAFNTASMIQKTVVDSINKELQVDWNGFYSLCILYAVFSVTNFLAPSVLLHLGARISLFLSACSYLLFIFVFLYPVRHVLNIVSVVIGFGAAVIWTAQGSFLTQNSTKETLDRNTGIFWAIFQGSLLFGNLFVYFKFRGVTDIAGSTRIVTYTVFTIVCGIGTGLLLFLRPVSRGINNDSGGSDDGVIEDNEDAAPISRLPPVRVIEQVKGCFQLLRSVRMQFLLLVFVYSGLILSFYSGAYVTAVGATNAFGNDSSKLIGLCGMSIGVGEILGGGLFGLMGKRFNRRGRSPIILFGFILHLIAFVFTFLNLPDDSTTGKTEHQSYLTPSIPIALACGFGFGMGDACLNTQLYSIIGSLFPNDAHRTSSAFALFKFTQSISAAISFFYSQAGLRLWIHLLILLISSVVSTFSFVFIEYRFARIHEQID